VVIEAERRRLEVASFLKHVAAQIKDREVAIGSTSGVLSTK
jgi:hypothetical protein